jgi:hypothetical protein
LKRFPVEFPGSWTCGIVVAKTTIFEPVEQLGLSNRSKTNQISCLKVKGANFSNWLAALDDFRNWLIREAA